jgi:hypothetical protein
MLSAKISSILATGIVAALVISSSIFTPAYAQHKVLPKGTVIRIVNGIALLIPSSNTGYNVLQSLQKIITQAAPIPHITSSDGLIGHK